MHTKFNGIHSLTLIATLAMALTVSGCGGSDDGDSLLDQINNGSSSSGNIIGGGGGSNSSTPDTTNAQAMGFGSGTDFAAGVIGVSSGDDLLSAGGSATLTVNIVSGTGDLITESAAIKFNSSCLAAKTSELRSPDGTVVTSITTTSGEASLEYRAKGCVGADKIVATTSLNGATLTAQATVTVEADTVQSISFVDATPALISLKGTGGQETSAVRFRVLGGTSAPMNGECVTFALSTTFGGLKLAPSKCNISDSDTVIAAKTNADGYVTATVQSGSIATAVRVTATTSNGISTQSSGLAVGTGIPDQNSVSLSLVDLAPVGWRHDGVTSEAVMRMADAFNNPVPDGTAVSFTTNGGAIGSSCTTIDGSCSVTWKSQSPRPVSPHQFWYEEVIESDGSVTSITPRCPDGIVECRSARAKILATAVGNESFIDGNANGVYNAAPATGNPDIFTTISGCTNNVPPSYASHGANSCDDLSEAYIDKNFNGTYEADEEFADFNQNGFYDAGDGIYNGKLCTEGANCTKDLLNVRDDVTIVMACETPYRMPGGRLPGQPTKVVMLGAGSAKSVSMLLADCNGNGMPAGTTLTVKTDTASNVTASVSPSTPLGMSQEPSVITVFIKAGDDATKPPSGTVVLEITAPTIGGSVTSSIGISVSGVTTP